jgi:uncharacterized damage-inducible protein DinB
MTTSLLADAFGHHVWATARLLDACADLTPGQLDTNVPGTFGSIIDTLRHLVGADASYLSLLSDGRIREIDEAAMDVAALREAMVAAGPVWAELVSRELDPAVVVIRRRDDGSESAAPLGVRLAQAVHHGTDHRSQVCTALTALGIEPPAIDVWDYAWDDGRLTETAPTASG